MSSKMADTTTPTMACTSTGKVAANPGKSRTITQGMWDPGRGHPDAEHRSNSVPGDGLEPRIPV